MERGFACQLAGFDLPSGGWIRFLRGFSSIDPAESELFDCEGLHQPQQISALEP
jgi:hypothetical protein